MDSICLAALQYGCTVADLYHHERNHQGIGNVLIFPEPSPADRTGPVRCRSRLSGMLNYYDRAA